MTGLRDGTRVVITGNPTPEEVAAAVVAVDRVLERARPPASPRPAWRVAARLEGTGHRLIHSPWELSSPERAAAPVPAPTRR